MKFSAGASRSVVLWAVTMSVWCLLGSTADAQSFDCNNAVTTVEHVICTHSEVAAKNRELADRFAKLVASAGDKRSKLLSEQKRWLRQRNQACMKESGQRRSPDPGCLEAFYADRLDALGFDQAAKDMDAVLAVCGSVADAYRKVATSAPGRAPLDVLSNAAESDVSVVAPVAGGTFSDLVNWAKSLDRPFDFPDEFAGELKEMSGYLDLLQLPGTSYFAVHSVEGSAHCYNSKYFSLQNGRPVEEQGPPDIEDDEAGDSCGVSRMFGRVRGTPVYFQQDYDHSPSMRASVRIVPWVYDRLSSACEVRLSYFPSFSTQTLNKWEESCAVSDCPGLKQRAFAIVQRVQKSPLAALKHYLGLLSKTQRGEFEAAVKASNAAHNLDPSVADKTSDDPDRYVDEDPLRLPFVFQGKTFLVSAGHKTIGWRIFGDWSVVFETLEGSTLAKSAVVPIGMGKGGLKDAVVVPFRHD